MRHFGTVKSFNEIDGHGFIQPENGAEEIGFERSAPLWRRSVDPPVGQGLSYEVARRAGQKHAVNLEMFDRSRGGRDPGVYLRDDLAAAKMQSTIALVSAFHPLRTKA